MSQLPSRTNRLYIPTIQQRHNQPLPLEVTSMYFSFKGLYCEETHFMGSLQFLVTANYDRACLGPGTGNSHFKIQLLATWSKKLNNFLHHLNSLHQNIQSAK
jgi:hypothetical protein